MRRADTNSGILVMAVAAFFGIMALRMPWRASQWGITAAPGLVPLVLATALLLCGLVLVTRAKTGDAHYKRMEALNQQAPTCDDEAGDAAEPESPSEGRVLTETQRVLLTVGLAVAYILLLGRIHYAVATALYIFASIAVFQGKGYGKAAIVAVVSSAVVWFVFTKVFFVFLP